MDRRSLLALGLTGLWMSKGELFAAESQEEGFVPIFNGKDLSGLVPFLDPNARDADPAKTFTVRNGVLVISGHPNGYIRTEKEFGDFILRFEYQMMAEGNSGVFLMVPPDQIWPRGVEFQLWFKEVGRIFGVAGGRVDGGAVLQRPAKPIGQWNTYEIINWNGFVATVINGHLVAVGANAEPRKGHLIFQSEGVEIRFRNIRIRPLT
ncbi:MAG: DUF1080 domain-containing protein [Armatimonadetes bacterium]|nr:DUF1080 domain-containing protein [Armatimonadota bacterium]MDW8122618.1 DUF1080 domain-containing protein [Armatimonadota bacterium]